MADISKIQIESGTFDVKDELTRKTLEVSLFDTSSPQKFAILGDSNAEGYGMWEGNRNKKSNDNDGVFSFLRKKYPQHTFENFAISGTTISQLDEQIARLTDTYSAIFLLTGMNDITNAINNSNPSTLGYCKDPINNNQATDTPTTSCDYLAYYIKILKETYTDNVFYIVSPTTGNNEYLYFPIYNEYIKICKVYGAYVINANSVLPNYRQNNEYYFDRWHLNDKGFKDYLVPLIESSILGERNQYILNKTSVLIVPFTTIQGNVNQTYESFKNVVEILKNMLWWYDTGNYVISNFNNFWSINVIKNYTSVFITGYHLKQKYQATIIGNDITYSTLDTGFDTEYDLESTINSLYESKSFVIKDCSVLTDLPSEIQNINGYVYCKYKTGYDGTNIYKLIELHPLLNNNVYYIKYLNSNKYITKVSGESIS